MDTLKEQHYRDKLENFSKQLILYDGLILVNSFLKNRDRSFILSMIPYLSLFCISTQDFFNIPTGEGAVTEKVIDIRNGIKVFTDRYGKSKKFSNKLDLEQDTRFKEMLRFNLLKRFNLHRNIGVYFTSSNKIIFNTQLASSLFTNSGSKKEAFSLGKQLGELSAQLLIDNFRIDNLFIENFHLGTPPKYGYIDFNTNRLKRVFNTSLNKDDNLNLLHVLSMLGFVNNYLRCVYEEVNLFLHRVSYIVVHNTVLFLRKLLGHLEQSDKKVNIIQLNMIIDDGEKITSTEYRNVMIHYRLIHDGNPSIKQNYLNVDNPLFGLVESSFLGEDFQSYNKKLCDYSEKLKIYLEANFTFDYSKINYNW